MNDFFYLAPLEVQNQGGLAPSSCQSLNLSFASGEIRIHDNPLLFIRIFVKTKLSAYKGMLNFQNNCTMNIVCDPKLCTWPTLLASELFVDLLVHLLNSVAGVLP